MKNNVFIRLARLLPDQAYLSLKYLKEFGRFPNWKNPQAFTEKLQWLKLHDRNPEYTRLVDKYAVKEYVESIIGKDYIIPTYAVWDRPEEIEWDSLPEQFVLKTTHGGGGDGVVICKDKSTFDREEAIRLLNENLKTDLYVVWREWPYKNVPKRIIAEKFIAPDKNASAASLMDYKFFCFKGKVRFFKVDFGRFVEHHANYYDINGKLLPFGEKMCQPDPDYPIELPRNLNEMISLSERLAGNLPFLRVDFYNIEGRIFFGELTFYPASGMDRFVPDGYDMEIGTYLEIPKG